MTLAAGPKFGLQGEARDLTVPQLTCRSPRRVIPYTNWNTSSNTVCRVEELRWKSVSQAIRMAGLLQPTVSVGSRSPAVALSRSAAPEPGGWVTATIASRSAAPQVFRPVAAGRFEQFRDRVSRKRSLDQNLRFQSATVDAHRPTPFAGAGLKCRSCSCRHL